MQRRVGEEVLGQVEEDSSVVELGNERFLFAARRMEHNSTLKKNYRLLIVELTYRLRKGSKSRNL